jgi:hypothetical protein
MHRTILAAALAVIGRCRRQRGGGGSDAVPAAGDLHRHQDFAGGEYVAATVPREDSTAIAILRLKDKEVVGSFWPPSRNHAQNSTGSATSAC